MGFQGIEGDSTLALFCVGSPEDDTRHAEACEMIIRRATSGDALALRAILHDTFESTWLPELTPAAAQRYRDEDRPGAYVRERSPEFRVAECDGQVVGFVDWNADFINALHVHSGHALRGLGSRLMDLAEQEIAGAGFP